MNPTLVESSPPLAGQIFDNQVESKGLLPFAKWSRSAKLVLLGPCVGLGLASTTVAEVTDLSGDLTEVLDSAVGAGNSGRLIANVKSYWQGNTSVSDIDLNGFQFHIDTGNGNGHRYNGAISGPGSLHLTGRFSASWSPDVGMGGPIANTPDSVTIGKGRVSLGKSAGVDALAGPIAVAVTNAGNTARILLEDDEQINDSSVIDSTSSNGSFHLELDGHSETITGLAINDGHTVDTGIDGMLTVTDLTVDGLPMGSGTYLAATHGFVTGTGSVVVPGPPPTTVDVPVGYSNPDIVSDLGDGDAGTHFNMLGDAALGSSTGSLFGNISVNNAASTLTLDTGGNATLLLGAMSGAGKLTFQGNGVTGVVTLGGSAANSLTGTHTVSKGSLDLAKPDGLNAIAASDVVVGGGNGQAVLHWSGNEQVQDHAGVTLQGPQLAILDFDGHTEMLGTLTLLGDAEIQLGGGSAVVGFLASGGETWTAGRTLVIREWDGTPAGGGTEGIFFSGATAGLTPAQLAQVSFADPGGFTPGSYPAMILGSGELVPDGTPLDHVNIPDGASYPNITNELGGGDADTNYSLLGDAQIGWETGSVGGYFQISGSGQTLTVDTGGGNTTHLNGELKGAGNLVWIGGGSGIGWQTNASFLGGFDPNTLSGTLTIDKGTLAMAKPDGITAIAGDIVVGGGGNQAILRWDSNHQVADSASVTLEGPHPARLKMDGHSETMGSLIVSTEGDIYLGDASAVMHFADSSSETWALDTQFIVREWDGSPTGGGAESVFFGSSGSGLTADQLAQVGFMDPTGFVPGLYRAAILSTGEVVPTGTAVVASAPPYDLSASAAAARAAIYTSTGRADLSGAGTPLTDGTRIVFFGDSITWQNNYINMLGSALSSGAGTGGMTIPLVNRGINGGGAIQIRDGSSDSGYPGSTPQASFASLIASDQADIAVVFIGTNDVWWRGTTPGDYEQALRDIAASAVAEGITLIFATIAAREESPLGEGPNDPEIDQFSDIVRTVAAGTGSTLVDLRAAFVAWWQNNNYEIRLDGGYVVLEQHGFLTYDGVHPTTLGNELMADHLADGIMAALSGDSPFDVWAAGKGLSGAEAAIGADPDHDSIPNGIEFVIGGEPNPAHPDWNSLALLPTLEAYGANLVFTFTRMNEAASLNPIVEFSIDLQGGWTTAVDPDNATISVTPGTPAATVVVTIPKGRNPTMFTRLRVPAP